MDIKGTLVNINGRTGGDPGPAPSASVMGVLIPSVRTYATSSWARALRIRNLDATNVLRVFFKERSPTSYVSIPANSVETFYGTITGFAVQASAATVQWEATATVAE